MHSENWCRETNAGKYYSVRVFDKVFKEKIIHTITLNRHKYMYMFMSKYTSRNRLVNGLWHTNISKISRKWASECLPSKESVVSRSELSIFYKSGISYGNLYK